MDQRKKNSLFVKLLLLIAFTLFILIFPLLFHSNSNQSPNKNKSQKAIRTNQEDDSFKKDITNICSKSTENLRKYYETGNIKLIDLSDIEKEKTTNQPSYIDALLNIIKGENELKNNAITYTKHTFKALVFLIFGLAMILGWAFFCFFCCCNCCCCCCCKKTECKNNFLIFTLIFDFVIVILCILGLINCNKVFISLRDLECSILKFISETQYGESKNELPKWSGFDSISDLFSDISQKIDDIKLNSSNDLETKYSQLNQTKIDFPKNLTESYQKLLIDDTYNFNLTLPIIKEGTISTEHFAILDLIYIYGPLEKEKSFIYLVNQQYETLTTKAEEYIKKAREGFDEILQNGTVDNILTTAKDNIDKIKESVNVIKDQLADYIINYSDSIDTYGKIVIFVFFIIIMGVAIMSGVFITILNCCGSEDYYGRCGCGRKCIKTFSHISWNIMIFIMIITFIFGSLLTFFSYLGNDLVTVISILLSEDNLESEEPILLSGDASDYLNTCINNDGDLASKLELTGNESSTSQLEELNNLTNMIKDVKNQTKTNDYVISSFRYNISERRNLTNVKLHDINDSSTINLDSLINNYNEMIYLEIYDMWTLNDTCKDENYFFINYTNDENVTRKNTTDKECLNFMQWELNYSERYALPEVKTLDLVYTNTLKAANYYIPTVNNIVKYIEPSCTELEQRVLEVENAYNEIINTEIDVLDIYNNTIYDLVSVFNQYIGNSESVFSFLNCKFIGTNVLIILKNLKDSMGKRIKNIGTYFALAGFGMFFSVCFTILEIIIINWSIYETKRRKEKEEQFNLSTQRAVPFSSTERSKKETRRLKEK